ncbi:bifunctional adenosylcobinamide kinase/adenosylcobinamide-phosphate guanylyltransferase [Synechococcus sp. LTW-G]
MVVTGPSRSGKSRWAEHLAALHPGPVLYLATGQPPGDDEPWAQRIRDHQDRRPSGWQTLEVGADLTAALSGLTPSADGQEPRLLLIDALGTWLAQHLEASAEQWQDCSTALLNQLQQQQEPVILVMEEVGWGVVPATAIGGLFRDRMGELQQRLTAISHEAWLVVSGRALNLHELGIPVPR